MFKDKLLWFIVALFLIFLYLIYDFNPSFSLESLFKNVYLILKNKVEMKYVVLSTGIAVLLVLGYSTIKSN
mgnify:CR=1 FL=1